MRAFSGFGSSVTAKILTIGATLLLLLIPLAMIQELIAERSDAGAAAEAEIATSWGHAQTVGGPILIVPFRYRRQDTPDGERLFEDELYLLPLELTIEGDAGTQILKRGIYEIPVYSASLSVTGRLRPVDLAAAGYDGVELRWNEAEIGLPVSDGRALRNDVAIVLDTDRLTFAPGDASVPGFGPLLRASLAGIAPERFTEPQSFTLELELAGTGGVYFRPDGDLTRVRLSSNWPSPSFQGAWLPEQRAVGADGFDASWRIMSMGRGYPAVWRRSDIARAAATEHPSALRPAGAGRVVLSGVTDAAFGADLLVPVNVHTSSLRAIKYAALYLAVTFTAFFLFEVLAGVRLHPVQYLSVGLANAIFYLLLLAFAEHAGFLLAYLVSALGATSVICGYTAAILKSTRRALPIAALLAALYVYLYTTLRAEDYALVAGALGLFLLLTAFMYLTRRIDWYSIETGTGDRQGQEAGPA